MSEELKPQADADSGLDNLFRNTLDSHQIEPSRDVWKGISWKLLWAELAHFNFINLPKTFWIGAAGAVLVGMIFLFNQIPDGKTTENDYAPIVLKKSPDGKATAATSGNQTFPTSRNPIAVKGNSSIQIVQNGSSVQQTHFHSASPVLAGNNSTRIISTNKTNYVAIVPSAKTSVTTSGTETFAREVKPINSNIRNTNIYELKYLPVLTSINLFPSEAEDTLLRFTSLNGITNISLKTKVEIPQFYTLNLGISPELSVYRNGDRYSETNYWLNAGVTYHAGRFSVQSGVGLGYVFDHGNYRVNYKSKDSIGYFTSIISFIVTPGNIIVYTTKDIPVYDSLKHVADDRAVTRYTYLQIPLLLGYELFETNHFSLGIKAGPSISFLIGTKEAAPFIDYPNARLIRVENNTLSRVKVNWEIQAALDLEYRLVKNFSMYAQPYYKHYFKPFSTGESTTTSAKDPYSIGIEIGARYNFGQKRIKP
jgi:Outer membrane protein beta-barrel domain